MAVRRNRNLVDHVSRPRRASNITAPSTSAATKQETVVFAMALVVEAEEAEEAEPGTGGDGQPLPLT